MYPPYMWSHSSSAFMALFIVGSMTSCNNTSRTAAVPAPESEQQIGNAIKELYMAASAAAPQSEAQQKLILEMAGKAANGKELMLVMRAAEGVFPAAAAAAMSRVRFLVAEKMVQVATLDQLVDFARHDTVHPDHARAIVQRMFELANESPDARVWYQIRATASRLKVNDLETQARERVDRLREKP